MKEAAKPDKLAEALMKGSLKLEANASEYIDANTPLPPSIKVDFQPYGMVEMGNLKVVYHKGADGNDYPAIEGTVTKGTETSRLFQFSHTQDIKGERRTVFAVKKFELKQQPIIRVAM